jgi:2,3-dihydroxybiphenyl 1,2-dioxygenase
MNREIEIAYIAVEVPDPDVLDPVYAGVVGLIAGDAPSSGARTWRNDDRVHRVIVESGPANDAVAIGLEAVDDAAFAAVAERLRGAGYDVTDDASAATVRRVERLVRTRAPWGIDVEIVQSLERASSAFVSPLVPGGFLTDAMGFGHVVFVTTAFDESTAFLTDGLGFVQSDWLETEIAPGITLEVRFFHCNARHHTVALARAPFELPQTLHHMMFETNERDDVGEAFDRLWATDLGITNGLGRHDNDGMFSFYLQTPAGFHIEVGHGARVITDGWNDNRLYDAISAWGHQPLRTA